MKYFEVIFDTETKKFFDEVEREITVVDLVKPDPVWDGGLKTF